MGGEVLDDGHTNGITHGKVAFLVSNGRKSPRDFMMTLTTSLREKTIILTSTKIPQERLPDWKENAKSRAVKKRLSGLSKKIEW